MWFSKQRPIERVFVNWLITQPTIVVPKFHNAVFPNVCFKSKLKLVTLHWDENTFYHNVTDTRFPYIRQIVNIGNTKLRKSYDPIEITTDDGKTYFNSRTNQVHWIEGDWVNYEWLKSQFNEFFAVMDQNELHKRLE